MCTLPGNAEARSSPTNDTRSLAQSSPSIVTEPSPTVPQEVTEASSSHVTGGVGGGAVAHKRRQGREQRVGDTRVAPSGSGDAVVGVTTMEGIAPPNLPSIEKSPSQSPISKRNKNDGNADGGSRHPGAGGANRNLFP